MQVASNLSLHLSLIMCTPSYRQDMCHQAEAKSHESALECDRLHVLLADFKNRSEIQSKTAAITEKDLREKIETLHVDLQSLRVCALEAAAATAEEVSRGHEVRQALIDDLTKKNALLADLEMENRELMEGTIEQDRMLNASVNDSIDLGHRVMENDITLASINDRQRHEINELNASMEGNIRSSADDIEREITDKFMSEADALHAKLQELERANTLLEFEKQEFLEDMKNTYETVGQMEARLGSLIEENASLKQKIGTIQQEAAEKKSVFPNSSLESITSLEAGSESQSDPHHNLLTSPNKALMKITNQSRPRGNTNPPVAGRLERLEKFIETLQARVEHAAQPDKQVVFNIEALLACLHSIKQESEEMVVHTSTVATTSLLRQLRHRKTSSEKNKSSPAAVSSPLGAKREHNPSLDNEGDDKYSQQRQETSRKTEYPGNVVLNMSCNSDSDESECDEVFEEKKPPARKNLERQNSAAELFTQMNSSGDGFVTLPEFIKAVRKFEIIGKVLRLPGGAVIRQHDGSQDELVRLYNELVSDNNQGITYSNFSRYLEEHDEDSDEDDDDEVEFKDHLGEEYDCNSNTPGTSHPF